MLGSQVLSDVDTDALTQTLSCMTPWGKTAFTQQIHTNTTHSAREIKRRQLPLLALKSQPECVASIRAELAALDTARIDESIHTTDARVSEFIQQVLWKPDSTLASLNTSPTVLNGIITWKTVIVPLFAILVPIFALIVPYFLLNAMRPVQTSEYLEHVRHILRAQVSIPSFLQSRGTDDRFGFLLESLFIAMTLAMFISSLWNQVSSALHLRVVRDDIEMRGAAIQTAISCASNILNHLSAACDAPRHRRALATLVKEGTDVYETLRGLATLNPVAVFGSVWNSSDAIVRLCAWLGRVDAVCSICCIPNICFPHVLTGGAQPTLSITDLVHPAVTSCVRNSIVCEGDRGRHIVLTGPNRGGKSTLCRAVGLALLTAQSWGYAHASAMTWTPFQFIHTALEPSGKIGVQSTFEGEIEFAKTVLSCARGAHTAPVFVMMDEIFHSTNASDGVAASSVFLTQLYALPNVVSLVSTHYRQLATEFEHTARLLQMDANVRADTTLDYTYTLTPGISDKSSVMELLIERGLVSGPVAAPGGAVVQ